MKKRGGVIRLSLTRGYGVNETLTFWTVRKPIRLLNVRNAKMRRAISTLYGIPLASMTCDAQYSGRAFKPVLHSMGIHGTWHSSNAKCGRAGEIGLFANQVQRLGRTPYKIALREYDTVLGVRTRSKKTLKGE
jgi:hypothetical protein